MNAKQKKFCEYYAECANATEAAKKAGYSEKTAYSQGQRMLKNVEIAKYIAELQEKLASERIADITEVKEMWTQTMRDERQKTRDRLRAGELIAKSSGQFIESQHIQLEVERGSEETAKIFLPLIEGDKEYNAVRLPNGDIVPLPGHEKDDMLIYATYEAMAAIENDKKEVEADEWLQDC
jgi:phage terminase small subunit